MLHRKHWAGFTILFLTFSLGMAAVTVMHGKEPPPAPLPPPTTDGTVSFKVNCDSDIIDQTIRATLTVTKTGKKPFVNGNPGTGEVDGNHNFPAGTTADGVGNYYKNLLKNNGWKENEDFTVSGGTISFFKINSLDAGTNHKHLVASGSTNSEKIPWVDLTPKEKKTKIERQGMTQDGSMRILGFGIHWNDDATISTSTSFAEVPFYASQDAHEIAQSIAAALLADGWVASVDPEGDLIISHNAAGDAIYSIWQEIEYLSTSGSETNDDHWVFSLVEE